MKPLTELELRIILKNSNPTSYSVPHGTLLTPSAVEYLKMRRIEIIFEDQPNFENNFQNIPEKPAPRWDFSEPKLKANTPEGEKVKQLFYGPDGGTFDYKPESLTHLKGRQLVHKDHPLIIWRGKLDTLCARVVEAQSMGWQMGRQDFADELQEILNFMQRLLTYEIRGKEVEEFKLLGLNANDLRERSHNPQKFFGHRHMLTEYKMGPLCVALNTLRALCRECELAAVVAFKDGAGLSSRDDIIKALNRLSSLFYIMMFSYLPEGFVPEHSGI